MPVKVKNGDRGRARRAHAQNGIGVAYSSIGNIAILSLLKQLAGLMKLSLNSRMTGRLSSTITAAMGWYRSALRIINVPRSNQGRWWRR